MKIIFLFTLLISQICFAQLRTSAPVHRTTSQVVTGKTVDLGSNTITTTKAQLNTAISDDDIVGAADIGTNVQAFDTDLNTIAGLTPTTDNFMIGTSSAWASRTPAQARTQLGVDGTLFSSIQVLTSGTTYTPTAGTKTVLLYMIGGGGGGGGAAGANSNVGAAGGGGSGGELYKVVTGITGTYTYAIGTAGTAGANTGGNGGAGGNTTFTNGGTTYTAFGGSGGIGQTAGTTLTVVLPGAGGVVSTNGDANGAGSPGTHGYRASGTFGWSGSGGSSPLGGGGIMLTAAAAGNNATGFGSGGGGALSTANTNRAGGTGTAGVIIVFEYK